MAQVLSNITRAHLSVTFSLRFVLHFLFSSLLSSAHPTPSFPCPLTPLSSHNSLTTPSPQLLYYPVPPPSTKLELQDTGSHDRMGSGSDSQHTSPRGGADDRSSNGNVNEDGGASWAGGQSNLDFSIQPIEGANYDDGRDSRSSSKHWDCRSWIRWIFFLFLRGLIMSWL